MDNESALADFSGKVLVVYVADSPRGIQDGVVFEYPELRNVGGRLFLTGRVPEVQGQEWVASLQTAVAWDSVVSYVVFNSREEYAARTTASRPTAFARLLNRSS